MPVSDALVVGEAWISEHYFTTDARKQSFQARVNERRKAWDEAKESGTVRTRFTATRGDLLGILATLGADDPRMGDLYRQVEGVLGYDRATLTRQATGPVTRLNSLGLAGSGPLAIVHARAVDSVEDLLAKDADTLLSPYEVDEGVMLTSVARTVSTLFTASDHPQFVLVLAGRLTLVAERERWAEGRYLLVDLQLVAERADDRKGGEVDRALTVLDADSLAPDAEGTIWWHGVLDESVKHTVGVSADLREGVRLSIEIIANDVVARRRANQLDPLPKQQAQPLARQSLRYLYRILFLLYAEASPELGVLPVGAPEYERGYSLDRLRDLTLVELTTPRSESGTHLYESLNVLFGLIDRGHEPAAQADDVHDGLTFRSLRADLFLPSATALIDEVKLSNSALQQVLKKLLLSKERRGADRGFISYAELGINQLGAVYEGLMSYTGIFATTDLYEVAKGGDSSKGSWIVPVERADGIASADFVRVEDEVTGESQPVLHHRGSFVFRLAGRERQQSASYYTPEVLTKFVVSQALEELLDQDDAITPARAILDLTVCEPALGSGAFAIEAVRQLAEQYLVRRQDELGERIDPDQYPRELQKVKAYLALHQTYGVDLNATAVELAEISLWLDTMVAGLKAPWFGLHLRRGNSLIGARRAVFSRTQVTTKSWLKEVPRDLPLTDLPAAIAEGRESGEPGKVHHFLVPAEGWGSAVDAKEAKNLAPEEMKRLREWRKSVLAKPTKKQVDDLVDLGRRVEALWQFALRRLTIAEQEIRRSIDVWGADDLPVGGAVTREQIEARLSSPNSAHQRLRRVMNAWCALWFWPLTEHTKPPTLDQWIGVLQRILGIAGARPRKHAAGQLSLAAGVAWDELSDVIDTDLSFAGATDDVEALVAQTPWLRVCDRVAQEQGFFHWNLDFAPVFAAGGFDLQVGNPPWVRPRSDVEALLAEGDPWWQLKVKATQAQVAAKRAETLALPGMEEFVLQGTADVASTAAFVGSVAQYPHLAGLQPDLYRCFMEVTWRHAKSTGSAALISLESHFTDEEARPLRRVAYRRMRRHWQFINELLLFEIEHHKRYGISIYGSPREPDFVQAASIYHPDTVERSLKHDGSGPEPGIKDPEQKWDVRPHSSRIVHVTPHTLASWHAALEETSTPVAETRMVYAVNKSTALVLDKLAAVPRLGELSLEFSPGWHEKADRIRGRFEADWGVPKSWDQVILQGPHIHVATPFFKTPNPTLRNNQDWTATDFEALAPDAIPATAYRPFASPQYDDGYTHWLINSHRVSARSKSRLAWRNMAANTGERTFIPALIPPGAAHIHGISSAAHPSDDSLIALSAGFASSIVLDFAVRVAPKSTISFGTFCRLPVAQSREAPRIILRILRLSCATNAYADLWSTCYQPSFEADHWTGGIEYDGRPRLGTPEIRWSSAVLLRRASDRRQAQLEIDALVAIALGISVDELCTIYRTQFPVLYGYDRFRDLYDRNGRLVPNGAVALWRQKGSGGANASPVWTHPGSGVTYRYREPFETLDREKDLRTAYESFTDDPTSVAQELGEPPGNPPPGQAL